MRGKRELTELVAATSDDELYLVPADRSYRNFDVHMSGRKNATARLLMMSRSLHAQVISNARLLHPTFLATEVPCWSDIERMTVRRAPLPAFASRSATAAALQAHSIRRPNRPR